jgi:hypothetical protein
MKARARARSSSSDKQQQPATAGEYTNHIINPLLFSTKASGTNHQSRRGRGQEPPLPLQIINPIGNFGIALPLFNKRTRHEDGQFNMQTVIISGPEDEEEDRKKLFFLVVSFILLAILNITLSTVLFVYPNSVDISKVLPASVFNVNQLSFVEIESQRSSAENALFYSTITNLCIGILSAVFKQPLGLSCYVLCVLLIFFLGFTSIPYFLYMIRYPLDAFLAYVALVLISRLKVNFLKILG